MCISREKGTNFGGRKKLDEEEECERFAGLVPERYMYKSMLVIVASGLFPSFISSSTKFVYKIGSLLK